MGKNNKKTPAKKIVTAARRAVGKTVTEVRNTAIPKLLPTKTKLTTEISRDEIARRAYEIHTSGAGGDEVENWLRAERELRSI